MAYRSNDQQGGWYDEIMRGQYYDELIPAFEALQERMLADHPSSPLGMGLVNGCVCLARLVRRLVDGFRLPAQRSVVVADNFNREQAGAQMSGS